jgi:hypothetical protein
MLKYVIICTFYRMMKVERDNVRVSQAMLHMNNFFHFFVLFQVNTVIIITVYCKIA